VNLSNLFLVNHKSHRQTLTCGVGRAWIPLDLVEPLNAKYSPALARAFGHMLIVADEAAATLVTATHGLACVTLQVSGNH
jgi:hypothetical protein